MRSVMIIASVLACALASALGVVLLRGVGGGAPAGAITSQAEAPPAAVRMPLQAGVVADDPRAFARASGTYPSIDVRYMQWGAPFPSAAVRQAHGQGVTLMLVLEPERASLSGIASGGYGPYLKAWGAADAKVGLPVLLSFAPEANGDWYPWGRGRATPALYRAMWRTVHAEVTAGGATRVTWVWQVAASWKGSEALSLIWPGAAVVDETGIDSQLARPGDTFTSVFAPTLSQLREITRKPVMISEVGVAASLSRPAQISGLFQGAAKNKLTALILFDIYSRWEIDNDPAALAAFRAALREYG